MVKHCIRCLKYVLEEHFSSRYSCDACQRIKNPKWVSRQTKLLARQEKKALMYKMKLELQIQKDLKNQTKLLELQKLESDKLLSQEVKVSWNQIYNKRRQIRYTSDIQYRLTCVLRTRLQKALKNNQKYGSAIRDLGCTIEFLKQYLESLFQPGMTWENWSNKDGHWSIDHIIPLSKADLQNPEEFYRVNHYTNLRPMWHLDNIRKSNKIL